MMEPHARVGVTIPNVKNRTFRFVAETYRQPKAKCNTFLQRKLLGFSLRFLVVRVNVRLCTNVNSRNSASSTTPFADFSPSPCLEQSPAVLPAVQTSQAATIHPEYAKNALHSGSISVSPCSQ